MQLRCSLSHDNILDQFKIKLYYKVLKNKNMPKDSRKTTDE